MAEFSCQPITYEIDTDSDRETNLKHKASSEPALNRQGSIPFLEGLGLEPCTRQSQ